MARRTPDQLFGRALLIQHGRTNGHWLPIVRILAVRRHTWGMLELASWLKENDERQRADQLCRRAFRLGENTAAQHLAMNCFNSNYLAGYRYWLARAAAKGDAQCKFELRRFDTRLPHETAFAIKRGRPFYSNEGYGSRRPV